MSIAAILSAVNFVKNIQPKGWIVIILITAMVALLSTCAVNSIKNRFNENSQVRENNEDRELREELSVNRTETNTKIDNEERELNEELAKLPDTMPSDRRMLRACRELRDDGHVVLPAACGPYTH